MAGAEQAGNVADLLRATAKTHGDRPALVRADETRTWSELDAAADAGAAALHQAGLPAGGRVLIALPSGPNLALTMLAVLRAGAVAVPVDPTRADLNEIAGRFDVVAAITLAPDDGARPAINMSDDDVARWWRGGPTVETTAGTEGEQIAVIGRASSVDAAVLLSHRALLAAAKAVDGLPVLEAVERDRVLVTQPLFHATTFAGVFLPVLALGSAVVFAAAPGATAALEAVRELGVTVLAGGPAVYHTIRKNPAAAESLAGVRMMTSASAPLDANDFAGILKVSGKPVWEGYSSSETSGVACSSLVTREARPGSVGLPLPGVELRIVDGSATGTADPITDQESAAAKTPTVSRDDMFAELSDSDDMGLIEVRGPTLFSGYWPDGAGGPGADGWFRTGDVGYLDDRGELHLVDRAREVIKIAGFTVYPREVEQALDDHPYVADVAVVGVPGPRGEDLVAVVAVRPGTRPSHAELAEFAAQRLPSFKRPVRYRLVKTLPRNEVGRLDRSAARADYAAFAGIDLAAVAIAAINPVDPAAPVGPVTDAPVAGGEQPGAERDDAREGATEKPEEPPVEPPDVTPEAAADLGELGARLPAAGPRKQRYQQDTDEDLFGDEFA